MKRLSLVSAFILISLFLFSQKEANNWVFTTNTGLNFDTDPPTVLNNTPISFSFGSSCISDANGNLLLTTDGHTVWDRSGNSLMNGVNIGGDAGSTQSSLIVPDPSRSDSYYIFTVDKFYNIAGYENECFSYSRVNMLGNNGAGSVSEKDILLLEETPEYVSGVKHANGRDYWVVTHEYGNNSFYVFDITADEGLRADNPKIIEAGSDHLGVINTQGMLKFSPDGRYLASTQIDGIVELFSFDNQTGAISLISSAVVPDAYGVEFDADAKFLYVSTSPGFTSGSNPSQIFQYDLSRPDPLSSLHTVNTIVRDTVFGSLQLGPDRKIYCARFIHLANRGEHVSVIHNPSRAGVGCNFNRIDNAFDEGINLGGKKLIAGLPNFVTSFLDMPFFTYDSICFENTVSFDLVNKDNIDQISWDFGDPESASNNSSQMSPTHVFSATGAFNVSVQVTFNGQTYNYAEEVIVNPLPVIDFGADTIYLFPGAIQPLEVDDIYTSYLWNTGSTSNLLLAGEPGDYTVTVTDELGCWDRKTVTILPANIYFPNAFTPNGDGRNDTFGPKGANSGLYNIRMFVYNRFGQLMYESPALDELGNDDGSFNWDGTKGGDIQPTGTYVWVVKFEVEKEKGEFSVEQYSGSVTLLR